MVRLGWHVDGVFVGAKLDRCRHSVLLDEIDQKELVSIITKSGYILTERLRTKISAIAYGCHPVSGCRIQAHLNTVSPSQMVTP